MPYYFNIHFCLSKSLFHFILLFALLIISIDLAGQKIPQNLIKPICTNQSINTGAPSNSGITNIRIPCEAFQSLSSFLDFYYVKILSGSTFTFIVTPVGKDDYDFAAFLNPNWANINATPNANKRGSQNNPTSTGIYIQGLSLTATDLCESGGSSGLPEPGVVRYFDVKPGDEILIVIDRWSRTNQGYTMSFGGGGDAILDCTIVGNTYKKCESIGSSDVLYLKQDFINDLQMDYPGAMYKFYHTQQDAETNSKNFIDFPIKASYNSGQPMEIFVRVETPSGGFIQVVKLLLLVKRLPVLNQDVIKIPELCDDDGDGKAIFDLTQGEKLLVSDPKEYRFTYFSTLEEVNAEGSIPIANPNSFISGDSSVYVRVSTIPLNVNDISCFLTAKLDLKVKLPSLSSDTIETCSAYLWNGRNLKSSGNYEAHFVNVVGCDSTAHLFLTINFPDTLASKIEACGSYLWNNQVYDTSGQYEKLWQNIHGCDSLSILKLDVYPKYIDTLREISCEKYTWLVDGKSYTESGLYSIILKTVHGCDSLITLSLRVNPAYSRTDTIDAIGSYYWPVNKETYENSGIYTASLSSANGCDSLITLHLRIEDNTQFFFPNVLAKGGANGFFTGYSNKGQLTILSLNVYDRWGSLIFQNQNFSSNVPEEGWNGLIHGRDVPAGVYVWTAVVKKRDGTEVQYKGNITVLR